MKSAARLSSLPPYPFARLARQIAATRAQGMDVIRMDMGNPDLAPHPKIVEALADAAKDESNHGYPGFGGTPRFRQAVADYYRTRFGVEVDPEKEVLALIGSKEGIANISMAFVNPGDVVLVPDPAYPAYRSGASMAGGTVHEFPLLRERGFLPDLGAVPLYVLERARLLWLNYPNNPTSAIAPIEFLEEAVKFARRHDLLLCFDNPYHELVYDGHAEHSILQIPGAIETSVEFNSLSKTYNMAGWRIGMAVGCEKAIAALGQVKSNIDTGIFLPIQHGAAEALSGDQGWLQQRNETYQQRRDMILETLPRLGMSAHRSPATLYVWAQIPDKYASSETFVSQLLMATGVSLAPGVFFGASGEGYVRISLGTPTHRLVEALARMQRFNKTEFPLGGEGS